MFHRLLVQGWHKKRGAGQTRGRERTLDDDASAPSWLEKGEARSEKRENGETVMDQSSGRSAGEAKEGRDYEYCITQTKEFRTDGGAISHVGEREDRGGATAACLCRLVRWDLRA